MNKKTIIFVLSTICVLLFTHCNRSSVIEQTSKATNKKVTIFPDYTDITIPYNIAPLNFSIQQKEKAYFVKIYADNGKPITIKSANHS
ncbi:MAG TPA: hypothetical protein VE912_22315, partial [Bacteroidales bacterium]|nr:hypothetical protein [Bacteroidales bacterium]